MHKAKILLVGPIVLIIALLLANCATGSSEQINLTPEGDKVGPGLSVGEEISDQPEEESSDSTQDRLDFRLTQTPPLELERVQIPEDSPVIGEVPFGILDEILADLSERTSAQAGDIKVIRAEALVWNDGSLGCPQPGEVYIQMMISGYWVVAEVEGVEYDYRASDSGHFKLCEGASMPPDTSPETIDQNDNPLVLQAKEDLAKRLGVQIAEIELLNYQEVVWPDASLGCPQPGMAYTQVPQDGTLIRLQAKDKIHNYHSGGNRDVFLCEQNFKSGKDDPQINIIPPSAQ
jgi:hypothetical protein